jgi:hypothetical protein
MINPQIRGHYVTITCVADNRQKKQYRLDKPTGCDIGECVRPHYSNGLCQPHWSRRQEYGDPLAGPPLRKPRADTGKPRDYVRGRNRTSKYHVNHKSVRASRGPAWQYQCEHCGAPAAEWATKTGATGESADDFISLCKHCHALYDDFAARLVRPAGETHHSARLTEQQVREIRSRTSETAASLAIEFGVTESAISAVRTGKSWKRAGGQIAPPRPRRAVLSAEPGQRFGKLAVSGPVITREVGSKRRKAVQCTCDCGKVAVVDLERLLYGNTKSCGCLKTEAGLANRRLTVETGQRFGRGVVVEADLRVDSRRYARLRCDCGREYESVIYALLNGATVSCGCRSRETQIGGREGPCGGSHTAGMTL